MPSAGPLTLPVLTKAVDEQVIPVVFPEHADLARRAAVSEAVEEEEYLDAYALS